MCYNISYQEKRALEYHERYKHLIPRDWMPVVPGTPYPTYYHASGFNHPLLPVVRHDGIFNHYWGLIPFWTKTEEDAELSRNRCLNAKAETIFELASFRKPIRSQRCILGVTGFYESHDFKKVKYPFYIKVKD